MVTSYYLLSGTRKKTSTTITKIGLCPIYISSDDLLASIQLFELYLNKYLIMFERC